MKLLLLAVTLAVAATGPMQTQPPDPSPILVIRGAQIIDTTGGPTQPDRTVIVRGDRIVKVGKDATTAVPSGARVIDASGRFLLPGLWDMHVHTFMGQTADRGADATVPLLIANGITGVRDMGSDLDSILRTRRDIEERRIVGPRMVVAGPMLDGPDTKICWGTSN